jgi:hypothetical protein
MRVVQLDDLSSRVDICGWKGACGTSTRGALAGRGVPVGPEDFLLKGGVLSNVGRLVRVWLPNPAVELRAEHCCAVSPMKAHSENAWLRLADMLWL